MDCRRVRVQLPRGGDVEIKLSLMDGSDTPRLELDDQDRAVRLLDHAVDGATNDGTAAFGRGGERQFEDPRRACQRSRDIVSSAGVHPDGCRPTQQTLLVVERDSLLGAKQTTTQPHDVGRLGVHVAMLEETVHENAEEPI